MTSIQSEIEIATDLGNRLIEVYARLRLRSGSSERTELLRQADEAAGSLGACLSRIAAGTSEMKSDPETSAEFRALGELIERVMVQEREYRLAAGGSVEEDDAPAREEELI